MEVGRQAGAQEGPLLSESFALKQQRPEIYHQITVREKREREMHLATGSHLTNTYTAVYFSLSKIYITEPI